MEYHLETPLTDEDVTALSMGDIVYISGSFITARDKAHMRMVDHIASGKRMPFDLRGSVIFHGAPIVKKKDGDWEIVAIGPTTSARMNDLEPDVIRNTGVKAIVGKGGMDRRTLEALHESGTIYLSMTGGIAVLGAKMVVRVKGVEWLDLGLAEAVWILEVKDFGPLTVTMDAHMHDLYENIRQRVSEKVKSMR